jgi:hypothetical protein
MDQILDIIFSIPFVGIAVIVAILMLGLSRLGEYLWKLKKQWLRKAMKILNRVLPVLPALIGAGLGAIPLWPLPEPITHLNATHQIVAMIVLGLFAGSAWERVWKTFKSQLEARGIDLDSDEHPSKQCKTKE